MKRSALKLILLVLTLSVLAASLLPAGAAAKHRPYIYWTLPATANEGQSVSFTWRGKYFGRHYKVVVERPFGTSHVWKGIMQLDASGNGTLPGMRLGPHWFRIVVYGYRYHRWWRLAQQTSVIKVFGTVPFTTLFNDNHPEVLTLPGSSFSFVESRSLDYEGATPLFGVQNNNCSYVHVDFASRIPSMNPGEVTVTIVQEARDPVSATAPFSSAGSVVAELTPGQSWGVNASTTERSWATTVYLNGYAICYSTEAFHE